MELTLINFVELGVSALITVMVGSLWRFMSKSVKKQADAMKAAKDKQEEVEERAREFELSMERGEIIRYYRYVVEQDLPIMPDELAHIESCYNAYEANGGNGTVKLMYRKIQEHAKIITNAKEISK